MRELATAHLDLLPTWAEREKTNDNRKSSGSDSRANRIRVEDANKSTGKSAGAATHHTDPPKRPYTDSLIKALKRFEWEGMTENPHLRLCDERADGSFGHNDLPSLSWVVHELLPTTARQHRKYHDRFNRFPSAQFGESYGYGTLDVSWTRPPRLMPFAACCSPGNHLIPSSSSSPAQGQSKATPLQRIQTLLEELWDDVHGDLYEFVKVNFPASQVALVETSKRKGDPERQKLLPHLKDALRHPDSTVTGNSSGNSSGSGSEGDEGDRQGRPKRARHSH